jgi:hypothetical protein
MLTFEEKIMLEELDNLPTVKYPDEVMDRFEKIAEVTLLKFATGEIQHKTADELAAELGVTIE